MARNLRRPKEPWSLWIHKPQLTSNRHTVLLFSFYRANKPSSRKLLEYTLKKQSLGSSYSLTSRICEKIKAQQMSLGREGEGARFTQMTPQDDVEDYLEACERTAMAATWDPSSWAVKIGPFFIGPAQASYLAFTRTEARDYEKVKKALLYRLEISPETYWQKFRAQKRAEGIHPQLLAQTLRDLVEWCLQPEIRTTHEIVNLIVLKQFLTDLGSNTQCWVRCHQTKMVEEALQLAEDYGTAEGEGDAPRREHPTGPVSGSQKMGPSQGRRVENDRNPS